MTEVVLLLLVLGSGSVVLGSLGLRGWPLLPLGFLAGSFAVVILTTTLGVLGLSTRPSVVLLLLCAAVGSFGLVRRAVLVQTFSLWHVHVVGVVGVAVVTQVTHAIHLVKYTPDSYRYLVMSGLLANDHFPSAEMDLLSKRMMSAPAIHSLASLAGEPYLRAFTPLLALAVLGVVAWAIMHSPRQGVAKDWGSQRDVVLAVGAVVLLASFNRFIWHAFYVNDHLFFAAALLVLSTASWLLLSGDGRDDPPLMLLSCLATAALVLTRPEGFIFAAVANVPLLGRSRVLSQKRALLGSYGATTVGYYGYLLLRAGQPTLEVLGPILVGAASLILIPLVGKRLFLALEAWLERAVALGVGALLGIYVLRDPGVLTRSIDATWQNLGAGAGAWGTSLLSLGVLVAFSLLLAHGSSLHSLRFPVTMFLPIMLLLAYLRGGSYRVGPGDSLNRMLIQVVPLAVLFVAVSIRHAWGREQDGAAVVATSPPPAADDAAPGGAR